MKVELKEDNTKFLEDYNNAIKPVIEEHGRQLIPVFRFGNEWLPGQLLVDKYEPPKESAEPEAEQPADRGAKAPKAKGGKD